MSKASFSSSEDSRLIASTNVRNILLAALSSLLYIVVFGMVSAYSAPSTEDMSKPGSRFVDITSEDTAWIASLPSLSGAFGNLVSGYIAHRLGRKRVLMFVSASYTFSWLVIAYAPHLGFVFMGRLISGFCAGICCVAVPAYVVEISTVEIRGLLSAGFQVAFALGVFLIMAFGIVLRWSWLAVSGAAIVVFGACLMVFMPESPPWLMRCEAAKEFQDIMEHLADEPKKGLTLGELFRPELYKPMVIAIALMFFQQFVGINSLMSYCVEIFQNSGGSITPTVAATLVALVQVLTTIFSSLLMDKAGRRTLYITSGTFIALSLTTSGTYTYLSEKYNASELTSWSWIPLASFMTYIAAFSLGFGPVPFVVTPEMVPTRTRSFLLAMASVFSSLFSFLVTKTFDSLRSVLGMGGLYWTYAGFAILGVLFYSIFVPETKGRTIQDIHRSFSVPEES